MAAHSSILAWRVPTDTGARRATVHGAAELDMTERLSTAQHLGVEQTPEAGPHRGGAETKAEPQGLCSQGRGTGISPHSCTSQ